MAELVVIYWRDIPAQVVANHGDSSARAQLTDRFQKAIDAAAMSAGLAEMDAYLAEWRQEARECGPDLEAEVAQEVSRLEGLHTSDVIRRLIRSGGIDDERDASQ